MNTFTPSAEVLQLLEQMSRDMAVPVEGLVNQAVFSWARLHGYAEPSAAEVERRPEPISAVPTAMAPKVVLPEPETSPAPVVDAPEDDPWKVMTLDATRPGVKAPQRWVLVLEDREVVLEGERFLIGRDVTCDLIIDAPRVSRQHAVIHRGKLGLELQDLGSSNGTWFEGERLERRQLQHGDEIRFGESLVRFELR